MANRKLQTEIERTLKKVAEGVEAFEAAFEKIQQANQPQKEKLEGELKKEIKKLQRFRDQIKTWCASNEIKDKKNLMENRKLIETQMERFKAMERELKTKAYSQAGLAASKMDPEEKEKEEIRSWITEMGEKLTTQLDMLEVELESLKVGSKKKRQDKNDRSSKISHQIERHKFHQTSLEIILRMLDNGDLKPDDDDVAYYVDENQDPDFEEDEDIYQDLNLETGGAYGIVNEEEEEVESVKEEVVKKKEVEEKKKEIKPVLPKKKPDVKPVAPPSPRAPVPAPVDPLPLAQRYAAAAASSVPSRTEMASPIRTVPAVVNPEPPAPPLATPFASIVAENTSKKAPKPVPTKAPVKPPKEEAEDHVENKFSPSLLDLVDSFSRTKEQAQRPDPKYQKQMLEASFINKPNGFDSQKPKHYLPKNPYPVPGYYPQSPLASLDQSQIFERFDVETLFFIFYFKNGTYVQYLAAKELKKQSWRFHKKSQTWFRRHEEPKAITEEYEQGNYIYFDYQDTWTERKKTDFRFEYRYLEDE